MQAQKVGVNPCLRLLRVLWAGSAAAPPTDVRQVPSRPPRPQAPFKAISKQIQLY